MPCGNWTKIDLRAFAALPLSYVLKNATLSIDKLWLFHCDDSRFCQSKKRARWPAFVANCWVDHATISHCTFGKPPQYKSNSSCALEYLKQTATLGASHQRLVDWPNHASQN